MSNGSRCLDEWQAERRIVRVPDNGFDVESAFMERLAGFARPAQRASEL